MLEKFDYPITDPINTFIVTYARNGLTLTKFIDIEGKYYEPVQMVYEAKSWGLDEPDFDCVANFLWDLLEVLEIYNSKYYKKRINIEVVDQED